MGPCSEKGWKACKWAHSLGKLEIWDVRDANEDE